MKDSLIVKILQEGDKVLNVSHQGEEIHIVVQKSNEEVVVWVLYRDEKGQPILSKIPEITITFGDGMVEARATDSNGQEFFSLTTS
jgi:hypothetical protein